ncbi:MAG: ATP-dependent helicase RecQ [Thermoleophilaceae bacterium]|jgi:ATP-dependent DNA helicase RecQ|nr:ATP-dependent helicase RecQ [Thermoleophilaceae bacterium]
MGVKPGARIQRAAKEVFGFDHLRPGQAEAVEQVLEGRDTLAVMSTGYGKSAIYQIAAMLIPGPTVVVSPLIALQRDQVGELEREGAGGAAAVSSFVAEGARREALEELAEGALEFLFLSPEQLSNGEVLADVAAARPSLFVVDEAHCISEWGHDFRPDYLKLGAVAEAVGRPPVLALTATASPPVRAEIVERLGMRTPEVIVRGFDRPNIWLGVERFHSERAKRQALLERVAGEPKPGIVYAATRRLAEELAAELGSRGVSALAYHGGMQRRERVEAQEGFMGDAVDVVVATTAFGMGVDKPNVRFVFHSEPADSVDSYYQEIGRGGREGEPARALLFFRSEDLGLRRFFAGGGNVDADEIRLVAETVAAGEPLTEAELSQTKLATAVTRLEDVGGVAVLASGEVVARRVADDLDAVVDAAWREQEDRQQFDRSRVEMMGAYAESSGCRREFVLTYFGERFSPPCGNCDNCLAGRVGEEAGSRPFAEGARVAHQRWGEGTVQRYEEGAVVVLFESVGYKKLGVDIVLERGLLASVDGLPR